MRNWIYLALIGLCTAALAGERVVEKSFAVSSDAGLVVDHHKGRLMIHTQAADEISVKARVYMEDGSEADEALLDKVQVLFEATTTGVKVAVDYEQVNATFKGLYQKGYTSPSVDLDILVPLNATLRVSTHKGTIDIQAPSGNLDIETHKGTGKIQGIRGDLNLNTHKGELTLGFDQVGDIDLNTHKGDVTMNLPGGDFQVTGNAYKGDIRVNGRQAHTEREKRGMTLSLTEGKGTHLVSLNTHKGMITLNFVD